MPVYREKVTSTLLLAALSTILYTLPGSADKCYLIDGSPAPDSYAPCDPDADVSACCALRKPDPDICLSSGLCYAQDGEHNGYIYSNGCTDQTGLSDKCPHFCPDRTNNWDDGDEIDKYNVLQCYRTKYCCRETSNSTNCCDDDNAIETFSNIGTLLLPRVTSTTSVAAEGPSRGAEECSKDNTEEGSRDSTRDCPKDNTAVVGGAVGGILGAALLTSLGIITVLWRRRTQPLLRPYQNTRTMPPQHEAIYAQNIAGYTQQPYAPTFEIEGTSARAEVGG